MSTYCRQLPISKVIKDPDILLKLQETIINTNHIVRDTYQFIRFYFLYLLENNLELPLIDVSFIKIIFSLVSNSIKTNPKTDYLLTLKEEMKLFYITHYLPLQIKKVKSPGKDILDYEAITIITSVENHIKNCFCNYINRLTYFICPNDKSQVSKVKDDLYNNTRTSDKQYHGYLEIFSSDVEYDRKNYLSNPQGCLPLLYRILVFTKNCRGKHYSLLPLRTSFIPCYITIDKTNFNRSFNSIIKEKKVNIWSILFNNINMLKLNKKDYEFTSLKTDGIVCSLTFRKEKRSKKKDEKIEELYLENLGQYDTFKDKKIVAIDPNKGNLVYCWDGENTLRYTQNERRYVSRGKKYKRIRDSIEEPYEIQEYNNSLSYTSSRSISFEEFKLYLEAKNEMAKRVSFVFEIPIYRKLHWNTKINIRRSEDNFINKFKDIYGSKDTVIAFGDWEENKGFRGKEPTKGKGMRKMFRQAGYPVYLLNEFRTSKLCCKCYTENEVGFITRKNPKPWKKEVSQEVWGLLRCKNGNCRRVHNRDFNSASNILNIAKTIIDTGERPLKFIRKTLRPMPSGFDRSTDT